MRVDSAVHEGAMVQPYYDSLVAKLIVYAPDRESAIRKLLGALDELDQLYSEHHFSNARFSKPE